MEKNIQLPESAVRDLILLISDLKSYELDNETSATVERLETVMGVMFFLGCTYKTDYDIIKNYIINHT